MKPILQNGSDKTVSEARGIEPSSRIDESAYLAALGDSIRAARARRSVTRRVLAEHSGVSERFLAQLESGSGNASILVLRQIADALDLPVTAILPDGTRGSELEDTIQFLGNLDSTTLAKAHQRLIAEFGGTVSEKSRDRIAFIGLRGAGKSTIGKLVAERLEVPFIELDKLIEKASGVSLGVIFDMYGQNGFRRFERRCLEDLLSKESRFVLATGGSLVSEPDTYDRLLGSCYTVWLRARPQEHMSRVVAQGDMRPMAQSSEAMADLERILRDREELYKRADLHIDTSGRHIEDVLADCLQRLEVVAPA